MEEKFEFEFGDFPTEALVPQVEGNVVLASAVTIVNQKPDTTDYYESEIGGAKVYNTFDAMPKQPVEWKGTVLSYTRPSKLLFRLRYKINKRDVRLQFGKDAELRLRQLIGLAPNAHFTISFHTRKGWQKNAGQWQLRLYIWPSEGMRLPHPPSHYGVTAVNMMKALLAFEAELRKAN